MKRRLSFTAISVEEPKFLSGNPVVETELHLLPVERWHQILNELIQANKVVPYSYKIGPNKGQMRPYDSNTTCAKYRLYIFHKIVKDICHLRQISKKLNLYFLNTYESLCKIFIRVYEESGVTTVYLRRGIIPDTNNFKNEKDFYGVWQRLQRNMMVTLKNELRPKKTYRSCSCSIL